MPEALLTVRGANLLSHLMLDVCALLGIEKLNTTAYHPECDGMVEWFNRMLKTMLHKRAAQFGVQWDKHLAAILRAYHNTPHETMKNHHSYCMAGIAGPQQKLHLYHLRILLPCQLQTTERS